MDELETSVGGPVVGFHAKNALHIDGFGFGVYRDRDIGIMRAYMPAGSQISMHVHYGAHEWVGVIRGRMRIDLNDTHTFLEAGPCEVMHILPGCPHTATAIEDTWCWGVTVPPAVGYPDVTECPFAAKESLKLNELTHRTT